MQVQRRNPLVKVTSLSAIGKGRIKKQRIAKKKKRTHGVNKFTTNVDGNCIGLMCVDDNSWFEIVEDKSENGSEIDEIAEKVLKAKYK